MEIRNIANGELLAAFHDRVGNVQFVEWCSDHAAATVVDNDPYGVSLEVWDTRRSQRVARYPFSGRANVLVASSVSKRLLFCTEDGQVHTLSLEEDPLWL
jgi:hypothetical protein